MKIKNGFSLNNSSDEILKEINISAVTKHTVSSYPIGMRMAEIWINNKCSYLSIDELLDLRIEIDKALNEIVKQKHL